MIELKNHKCFNLIIILSNIQLFRRKKMHILFTQRFDFKFKRSEIGKIKTVTAFDRSFFLNRNRISFGVNFLLFLQRTLNKTHPS